MKKQIVLPAKIPTYDPVHHRYEAWKILTAVSKISGINILRLDSKERSKGVTAWRDIAYCVAEKFFLMSPTEAAKAFGVSRSTIINSGTRTINLFERQLYSETQTYVDMLYRVYDTTIAD
jgi:chromosomal replication initiation ATPase DnaA